jgi:hypothetical protein
MSLDPFHRLRAISAVPKSARYRLMPGGAPAAKFISSSSASAHHC